jgi:hypothetical protein
MSELVFDCIGASADRYAAAPTLLLRLRISETTGARVHTLALRTQLRIDVQKRRYSPGEAERLHDLFGETARWGETLKPLQWTTVSTMVPGFSGSLEIDVEVPCTYDLDVATAKYFHALDDGEIPLMLMFSGTTFTRSEQGFAVELVPWHKETAFRLPVATWREAVEIHFPNSGWVRLRRDVLEDLRRFRSDGGFTTWDETVEHLLKQGGAGEGNASASPVGREMG